MSPSLSIPTVIADGEQVKSQEADATQIIATPSGAKKQQLCSPPASAKQPPIATKVVVTEGCGSNDEGDGAAIKGRKESKGQESDAPVQGQNQQHDKNVDHDAAAVDQKQTDTRSDPPVQTETQVDKTSDLPVETEMQVDKKSDPPVQSQNQADTKSDPPVQSENPVDKKKSDGAVAVVQNNNPTNGGDAPAATSEVFFSPAAKSRGSPQDAADGDGDGDGDPSRKKRKCSDVNEQ